MCSIYSIISKIRRSSCWSAWSVSQHVLNLQSMFWHLSSCFYFRWNVFRARLFRESCVYHGGNYVKDLNKLGRDLQKIVIVDNSPASYIFHPENAVSWTAVRTAQLIAKCNCDAVWNCNFCDVNWSFCVFFSRHFSGASKVMVRWHIRFRVTRLDTSVRENEQSRFCLHDFV